MTGADLVFYVAALLAVAGAASAALLRDRRRAATWLVGAAGTLVVLSLVTEAWLVAAAQAVVVFVAGLLLRRSAVEPESVLKEEEAVPLRWRGLPLVLAFLALTSRAVLIARWPLGSGLARPALPATAHVTLSHYILIALVLFAIGMSAIVLRRHRAAAWIGMQLMASASVVALVAVSHFVGATSDGRTLACVVVVLSALTAGFGAWLGGMTLADETADRLSRGTIGALAGITLALLTGAW